MRAGAQTSPSPQYPPRIEEKPAPVREEAHSGGSNYLPLFLAILALGMSAFSLYYTFYGEKPLSPMQREELKGIADDLRALQNKELTVTAPVQTTITLNNTFAVRDMFPSTFNMPLSFNVPINTQLMGVSGTGQPVLFRVEEDVPINTTIPISSEKAFGNASVQLQKTIPINIALYTNVRLRSAYREELNSLIDRLDRLSGNAPTSEGQ
jgi:hypothetical protein